MVTTPVDSRFVLGVNRSLIGKGFKDHTVAGHGEGGGWQRCRAAGPHDLKTVVCVEGWAVLGQLLGSVAWPDEPQFLRIGASTGNLLGSTLFGLDFDNDQDEWLSIDDLMADPLLSTAALIYETPSSWKYGKPRFRCLWWLPRLLSSEEHYDLAKKMMRLFPLTDKSCKNPNRLFYGVPNGTVNSERPLAMLDLDEVEARYQRELELGLIQPIGLAGDFDLSHLEGVPGQYGCYVPGIFDAEQDEIGLAVACLQVIPPRRQPGMGGTGLEYTDAFRCVMALLNVFGPELALQIIDDAGWHSPWWEIEDVIQSCLPYVGQYTQEGNAPADLGALVSRAKDYGMTREEINAFRR